MNEVLYVNNSAPLEGPYAAEAKEAFDEEWLLDMPPNQQDYMNRQECLQIWLKWADGWKIPPGRGVEERLQGIKEFLAITPPEKRCPCASGVELAEEGDHYPGCPDSKKLTVTSLLHDREKRSHAEDERMEGIRETYADGTRKWLDQ